MKKCIILFLSLLITTSLFAQLKEMQIKGEPKKVTNEIVGKRDANGNFCAAIKVVSNMEGLKYDSYNGVVGVDRNPGEDIVYLSSNERVLLIYNTGYNPKKLILTDQGIVLNPKSMWKITIIGEEELKSVSSKNVGKLNVTIKTDEANAYFEIEGLPITGESGFNEEIAAGTWKLNIKPKSKYYKSSSKIVKVEKDQKTEVSIKLKDISGYLTLEPNVKPIKVYLNGEYDKVLSTNHKKRLVNGKYNIKVEKAGDDSKFYNPIIKKNIMINKKGKVTKVDFQLEDLSGYLQLDVEPKPIRVYLDGEYDKVLSSLFKKRLYRGTYDIKIKKTGQYSRFFDTYKKKNVKIRKGQTEHMDVELINNSGLLRIDTELDDIKVSLNRDYDRILSRNKEKRIKKGTYNIKVAKGGDHSNVYSVLTKNIKILPGETRTIDYNPEVEKRWISLGSNLPKTTFVINDLSTNQTIEKTGDSKINLIKGRYKITAKKQDYIESKHKVIDLYNYNKDKVYFIFPQEEKKQIIKDMVYGTDTTYISFLSSDLKYQYINSGNVWYHSPYGFYLHMQDYDLYLTKFEGNKKIIQIDLCGIKFSDYLYRSKNHRNLFKWHFEMAYSFLGAIKNKLNHNGREIKYIAPNMKDPESDTLSIDSWGTVLPLTFSIQFDRYLGFKTSFLQIELGVKYIFHDNNPGWYYKDDIDKYKETYDKSDFPDKIKEIEKHDYMTNLIYFVGIGVSLWDVFRFYNP